MNIVADIGNTRCKVGVFKGTELISTEVLRPEELESLLRRYLPQKMLFSSVRPLQEHLIADWKQICEVDQLTYESRVPVKIQYDTPSTLGMDRLAAVCGARFLFPNKNVLVVDAGTCITYDFLDQNGVYHGGSISPGIRMRLKAMHEFTGALPLLDFEWQDAWPGTDTRTSMLTGVQMGILGEYLEMEKAMRTFNDNLIPVFTGGDAHYFVKLLKKEIFADPNLVLIGLNDILLQNAR